MSIFDAAPQVPLAEPEHVQLAAVLGGLVFLALVAISALPAARGTSAWFGLMPLWLLGMPIAGIAALVVSRRVPRGARRRVPPLPRRTVSAAVPARRRATSGQAVRKALDKAA